MKHLNFILITCSFLPSIIQFFVLFFRRHLPQLFPLTLVVIILCYRLARNSVPSTFKRTTITTTTHTKASTIKKKSKNQSSKNQNIQKTKNQSPQKEKEKKKGKEKGKGKGKEIPNQKKTKEKEKEKEKEKGKGKEIPKTQDQGSKLDIYKSNIRTKVLFGVVPGVFYLVCTIVLQWICRVKMTEFNAGLMSICFTLLVGFMFDVLGLKFIIQMILVLSANIPLMLSYSGSTYVLAPKFIEVVLDTPHTAVDIGIFYKIFLLVFPLVCSLSIITIPKKLYKSASAHSLIISAAVIFLLLRKINPMGDPDKQEFHILSIVLILPFVAVSLVVFQRIQNDIPQSRSYSYFSGITLSVVGLVGHFPEMLALFMFPLILNTFIIVFFKTKYLKFITNRITSQKNKRKGQKNRENTFTQIDIPYIWSKIFKPKNTDSIEIQLLFAHIIWCVLAFCIRYIYRDFL
ncbi:udp-n-acetylglucosamine--dolichyl-phosphate n-acetylglucosaminephosphotransferase [Anaeramoeba flamelloides]|uniref:Udp-n-acetylglucosamine--dolichyl-phosphate n-acetylglucosaminephosphotransferase n=1 Tax=Anaeramoeba flamelloides TaxID=1746091 RepID=A0AAV7ZS44_9EUKA|nr:udp-n-acetylglucosamine--dolichyl-phosphate n-acetylglucosaminephosphotransferase [Anaeramoeba flamelloides]